MVEKSKEKTNLALKIVIYIVLGIILCTFLFLAIFGGALYDSLKHPLSKWVPETAEKYIFVEYNDYLIYDSQRVSYNDTIRVKTDSTGGSLNEVLCVNDDVMYYVYKEYDKSANKFVWVLASLNLESEEFKTLYVMRHDKYQEKYIKLSYVSDYKDKCGGMYEDGKIYLKSEKQTISYNINTQETDEHAELPTRRYTWELSIKDKCAYIVDNDKDITRTITLESMAKDNSYAKRLKKVTDFPFFMWSTEYSINEIKCQDDQIYLKLSFLTPKGVLYDVVFKYDLEADKLQFLTYTSSEEISTDFCFAPVFD